MLKLLAFLWSGCWHQWEFTGGVTNVFDADSSSEHPAYRRYRYQCTRCQRVKEMRA